MSSHVGRNSARSAGSAESISVVIAAFHALPLLDEQLHALAGQDFDGRFEVVISDNAGESALRTHVEGHPLRDQLALRWVDSSSVPGTSSARNVGTRASRYPFVAYCDQDDRVHPGWLTAMASASASYDLVGGPLEKHTLNDPVVARWRALPEPDELQVLGRFLPITFGCNLGIWREVFDDIGGWDESYPAAGSDVEFCWRAQIKGYTLGNSPEAIVAYRFRTGMRESWRQVVSYAEEEARVARQYDAPGRAWYWPLVHAGVVVALLPVWPWAWSRSRRGEWVWTTGNLVGRIKGSIKYRIVYL